MAPFKSQKVRRIQIQTAAPIGAYIVDFVCFEKRIIVELDGGQHALPVERQSDSKRDQFLEAQGYKVLRFWDNEVLTNIRGVLEVIGIHCLHHPPLNPLPSREGK